MRKPDCPDDNYFTKCTKNKDYVFKDLLIQKVQNFEKIIPEIRVKITNDKKEQKVD